MGVQDSLYHCCDDISRHRQQPHRPKTFLVLMFGTSMPGRSSWWSVRLLSLACVPRGPLMQANFGAGLGLGWAVGRGRKYATTPMHAGDDACAPVDEEIVCCVRLTVLLLKFSRCRRPKVPHVDLGVVLLELLSETSSKLNSSCCISACLCRR